tara:strand:- start:440 stop:673 length:234 start_codon:yes stop_codon:yes gene_type:complete
MQDVKKIKKSRKKTTLVDLSSEQRAAGRAKPQEKPKESCQDKRVRTIKKAANGCWWIEQYLMADITTRKTTWGIGDE